MTPDKDNRHNGQQTIQGRIPMASWLSMNQILPTWKYWNRNLFRTPWFCSGKSECQAGNRLPAYSLSPKQAATPKTTYCMVVTQGINCTLGFDRSVGCANTRRGSSANVCSCHIVKQQGYLPQIIRQSTIIQYKRELPTQTVEQARTTKDIDINRKDLEARYKKVPEDNEETGDSQTGTPKNQMCNLNGTTSKSRYKVRNKMIGTDPPIEGYQRTRCAAELEPHRKDQLFLFPFFFKLNMKSPTEPCNPMGKSYMEQHDR